MLANNRRRPDDVGRDYQAHLRLERLKNAAFIWTLVVLVVAGAVTWLEGMELAVIVMLAMTAALLGVLATWHRHDE